MRGLCLYISGMENANTANFENVRQAVQKEFVKRCQKNPAYSLRAYAKYLGVDQSFLTKLLKGQRPVTDSMAKTLAPKVGIKANDLAPHFTTGTRKMPNFRSLSEDEFEFLAEWQHFAILELIKTKDFVFDPRKIAIRLGLHVEEVRSALERLERLDFVSIKDDMIELKAPTTNWSSLTQTSTARQKLQKGLLQKAIDAVEHVPVTERDNGSVTLAINKSRIPEMKKRLQELRLQLIQEFQPTESAELDEVYQLMVAFFPLTKTNKEHL